MFLKIHFIDLVLVILSRVIFVSGSFHKVVTRYHTFHADEITHTIVKRGLHESDPYNKIKEVKFSTLGREFRLILTPKRGILHSEFSAATVDENGEETPIAVDHENFYEGRLFGETDSSANVHIDDGAMIANIHHGDETYHIEPAWRHLPDSDNRTMVAYRGSDIRFSWDHDEYKQNGYKPCAFVRGGSDSESNEDVTKLSEKRVKRHTNSDDAYESKPTNTRCSLLLVADYRFFQRMGGSNTTTTVNYLITLIDRVHEIFTDTTWRDKSDADGFNGMGFVIKKILVHKKPTKGLNGKTHYNMVRDKWKVQELLEVFSRNNTLKDYCLAHLFTDLKFANGILGLAYVASPLHGSAGGICSPEYNSNKSYALFLNSGLSSSRNYYEQRVITREADLVTAHEFGHNWGSEHDPDLPDCSPSASHGGSYLMYTYSVSGHDINNKKFSPCSLRSIRQVLQAKSSLCFSKPQESLCGNLRVEKNEQCDAGLLGSEDNDPCCNKTCQLRPKAVCSDKNSPCCQNCQFVARGVKCRNAQYLTCEEESRCQGNSSECPKSPPTPDGMTCLGRGQCHGGRCVPYCETQGLQICMCDDIENSCKRCCRTSLNDSCNPVEPLDILPRGTPCIQGFCDEGLCRKTVQDVVERFWTIIEKTNINKFLLFLRDNVVGTVIVLTASIWIPVCMLINYFDKKRLHKAQKSETWKKCTNVACDSASNGSYRSTFPHKISFRKALSRKYNSAASFRIQQ